MLYLWEFPKNCPNKHIAVYDREISMDRFLFREGIFLTQAQVDKPIIFDLTVSTAEIVKYDDIPNNSASLLVNQKIMDILLEIAPDDVQFFDAEVRCKDGVLSNYKLLNITHHIIGMDHEKSIYSRPQPLDIILTIKYLTYKPGCMKNHKVARDEENLGHILVTEEIKQAFEKAKIKGPRIVTPEDYYREIWA
jgi:hypothetical protein